MLNNASPIISEDDANALRNIAVLRGRSRVTPIEGLLNEVAIESGYGAWRDIERARRNTQKLEKLIKQSFCVLVERADLQAGGLTDFEPMPLLWQMRKNDLVFWWRTQEEKKALRDMSMGIDRKARNQILQDIPRDYMGLRYAGTDPIPKAGGDVLEWVEAHGFQYPELAWLRGQCVTPDVIYFLQEHA